MSQKKRPGGGLQPSKTLTETSIIWLQPLKV